MWVNTKSVFGLKKYSIYKLIYSWCITDFLKRPDTSFTSGLARCGGIADTAKWNYLYSCLKATVMHCNKQYDNECPKITSAVLALLQA